MVCAPCLGVSFLVWTLSTIRLTSNIKHIFRYHGCYVKCQALILQKLSKLTPCQPNRRRKEPYKVENQQQGCLETHMAISKSPSLKFHFYQFKMHLCETSTCMSRRKESADRRIDRKYHVPLITGDEFEKTIASALPSWSAHNKFVTHPGFMGAEPG